MHFDFNFLHWALLLQLIASAACAGDPPSSHDKGSNWDETPQIWSIASMSYVFDFQMSCDVDILQTLVMNYTYGNYSSGLLFIPKADYDSLEVDRITSDNISINFDTTTYSDLYSIHYWFPKVEAPLTKTFIFSYKAIEATKTFSRSGSSSNSFSWETVVPERFPNIGVLNVVLNIHFHTAQDSIDSNPAYSFLDEKPESTTVVFPTERNLPPGTKRLHEMSFPKRVTCKPASSYKIVAVAVVGGSILFALITTAVALAIRKIKQRRKLESFERLEEETFENLSSSENENLEATTTTT